MGVVSVFVLIMENLRRRCFGGGSFGAGGISLDGAIFTSDSFAANSETKFWNIGPLSLNGNLSIALVNGLFENIISGSNFSPSSILNIGSYSSLLLFCCN